MQAGFARSDARLAEFHEEKKVGFATLRQEIALLETGFERRLGDLIKWSFVFWVGAVGAIAALAGGAELGPRSPGAQPGQAGRWPPEGGTAAAPRARGQTLSPGSRSGKRHPGSSVTFSMLRPPKSSTAAKVRLPANQTSTGWRFMLAPFQGARRVTTCREIYPVRPSLGRWNADRRFRTRRPRLHIGVRLWQAFPDC